MQAAQPLPPDPRLQVPFEHREPATMLGLSLVGERRGGVVVVVGVRCGQVTHCSSAAVEFGAM